MFNINASLITLSAPKDSSFWFYTIHLGWFIVYIEGSQVIIFKIYFLSLKIDYVSANSADPNETPQYVAFRPGLHCLSMYPFRDVLSLKS